MNRSRRLKDEIRYDRLLVAHELNCRGGICLNEYCTFGQLQYNFNLLEYRTIPVPGLETLFSRFDVSQIHCMTAPVAT